MGFHACFVVFLAFAVPAGFAAATTAFPGDGWITNRISVPRTVGTNLLNFASFSGLHAREVGGRLKIRWPGDTNASAVTAWISAEAPGHWKSRDWRPRTMFLGEQGWETNVPVEDPDEPVAYFVSAVQGGRTNFSILRSVVPHEAGLSRPTAAFWPFIEGFEEGIEGWWIEGAGGALSVAGEGRTGRGALRLAIGERGAVATVFTTRVRGSRAQSVGALGLRFWARGSAGGSRLRLTAFADAETLRQASASFRTEVTPGNIPGWQKVEVLFAELGAFPLPAMDRMAFEFSGPPNSALLIDDLELIGPWPGVK